MASFGIRRAVLVVDDDATVARQIQMILDDDGVSTILASDGEEALKLIAGGLRPDLLIVDLIMPNLNGWDFCAALAANDAHAAIPILIMTGGRQMPLKTDFPAVAGILRKPFNMLGLLGMVELAIAGAAPNAN